jgi:mono/diheme cytochrome c family protein
MRSWDLESRDLRALAWVVVILGLGVLTVAGRPQRADQSTAKPVRSENQIARGKYIVEHVAMCGMCHTPRTDSGEVDTQHKLDGAPIWLMPAHPTSDWPLKAPRLAGTPPASDEDMVRLLETGIWRDGTHLRPPMPQFRMSHEDAQAVVAYLRSLTPQAGQ